MHAIRSKAGAQGSFRHPAARTQPASPLRQQPLNPLWRSLATGVQAKSSGSNSAPLVQRMCAECEQQQLAAGGIQTQLTVGAANDNFEREADAVADQVMRTPARASADSIEQPAAISPIRNPANSAATPSLHKTAASTNSCCSAGRSGQTDTNAGAQSRLQTVQRIIGSPGSGAALASDVQERVQPVLNMDLGAVQVHNNTDSHLAAEAINAKAFTHQNHIYLGAGQSDRDVKLMAHELTHTVQQGSVGNTGNSATPAATSSPSVQALFDKGCYRRQFSGVYMTMRDYFFNRIGWVLIHPGECTDCEGQSVIDCCEPGDSYCEE